MDVEQDRIAAVRTADVHHLPRAAEFENQCLVNAIRRHDLLDIGDDCARGTELVGRNRCLLRTDGLAERGREQQRCGAYPDRHHA